MRIQDVMSKNVVSAGKETGVAAARERLRREEIDHLVIVEGKRVIGVVAGRDIIGAADDVPLSSVMSHTSVSW